ncbi:hypothetical protein [Pseudomonas brassicacearum]|uniref:hypothetical protein n=1 Tax=Pseudomonas brassicacearum TaxID=930166 RepID=UPI001294F96D|nr:hypothetical protein [Pseudomonas brassicacearum]QGA50038.1 hypothetical protein GFU70_13175 [Pseudomonas brassicacearum]
MRNDVVVPGYGAQGQAEIEAIMAHGVPFVLIYLEPGDDEAHADRKLRSLWLKTHKEAFGHLCISLISVLADEARRAHFDAMSKIGEQAYGIRYETAATQAEGERWHNGVSPNTALPSSTRPGSGDGTLNR